MNNERSRNPAAAVVAVIITWLAIALGVLVLLVVLIAGLVKFYQWSKIAGGQGDLDKARFTRQIAELDAQAEIARARGVSEANKIIADGLGGPEGYLRYLSIEAMKNRQGDTVYVPTEAGIPITEAGRFNKPKVD